MAEQEEACPAIMYGNSYITPALKLSFLMETLETDMFRTPVLGMIHWFGPCFRNLRQDWFGIRDSSLVQERRLENI